MQSSSSQMFAVVMATTLEMYIKSGNWKEIQDISQDTKDKVKTEKRRTIRKTENVTFPCTHRWPFSLYLKSSRPNSPITKPKLYTINWYFSSYLPFICFLSWHFQKSEFPWYFFWYYKLKHRKLYWDLWNRNAKK